MTNKLETWKKTVFIILSGQFFSLLSSSMVQFSIIWWLTDKTGSAMVLAIATIMGFLPQAVLGPFVGTLVDRYNRKVIMITADFTIALASLILAIIFFIKEPPVVVIYILLFIRSLATSFHMPAMQASVPMIVPQDELIRASGWHQLIISIVIISGPVLGVTILTIMSIEFVLLIDVLGAILANLALMLVRIPQPERLEEEKTQKGILKEMKYGVKELLKAKRLFRISLAIAMVTFIYMPVSSLFPLMVKNHFSGGPFHAGIVEAAFGVGMLLGSLALGILGKIQNKVALIGWSITVLGLGLFLSGMLPTKGYIGFVILTALLGVTGPIFSGPYGAMIQSEIEPSVLGRVMSLLTSMMLITAPVGLAVAGPLAEVLGVNVWFSISGALIGIVGLYLLFYSRREKGYNEDRPQY